MIFRKILFLTLYIFILNQGIQAQPDNKYRAYGTQSYSPTYIIPVTFEKGPTLKEIIEKMTSNQKTFSSLPKSDDKRLDLTAIIPPSSAWNSKNSHELNTVGKSCSFIFEAQNQNYLIALPTSLLNHDDNVKEAFENYKVMLNNEHNLTLDSLAPCLLKLWSSLVTAVSTDSTDSTTIN